MSSKAFRLVDELKDASSPQAMRSSSRLPETSEAPGPAFEGNDLPSEGIYVTEITPLDDGEWVSVTLTEGKSCRHIRLLTQHYAELRPALGRITDVEAEILTEAGQLCGAIQKGMELLGYGAMSRRRLMQKLTARKFAPDIVVAAAVYLEDHGYLSAAQDAIRFAEQGVRKLWGPCRIKEDLFARGFPTEVVSEAMDALEDVDFSENCACAIQKKYGDIPEDNAEMKKMVAALMRLGYTSDQIREALRSYLGK